MDSAAKSVLRSIFQACLTAPFAFGRLPSYAADLARLFSNCGTPHAGIHVWECPDDKSIVVTPNACRSRFCFACWGTAVSHWVQRTASRLLPTPHFHVVFELPRSLVPLWRASPAGINSVLLDSVRDCLLGDGVASPLGMTAGLIASVQSWTQSLDTLVHAHALLSAGGVDDELRWRVLSALPMSPHELRASFARIFRARFTTALSDPAWAAKHAPLLPAERTALLADLERTAAFDAWVSERIDDHDVIARRLLPYLRRGPFDGLRSLRFDGSCVSFRTRDGKRIALDPSVFAIRALSHIPGPSAHVVRNWGLYRFNNPAARFLASLAAIGAPLQPLAPSDPPHPPALPRVPACPRCAKPLQHVGLISAGSLLYAASLAPLRALLSSRGPPPPSATPTPTTLAA